VLLLLLVTALAAVGLVAVLLSDDSGSDRRDREATAFEAPETPEKVRIPTAPDAEAPRRPATEADSWPVTGFVRDAAGRPIPGAVVLGHSGGTTTRARTDVAGRYELVLPQPSVAFDVLATGFLPLLGLVNGGSNGRFDFFFEGDPPWTRDFTLEMAASLTGRVLDEQYQPVAGALVYVIPAEYVVLDQVTAGNTVRSAKDGTFSFPGLPAGLTDVGVRAPGFLPALARDVEVPERGAVTQDVTVKRGRDVKVVVHGAGEATEVLAADSRLRGRLLPPGGLPLLATGLVGRELVDFPVYLVDRPDWTKSAPGDTRLVMQVRGLPAGPVDFAAQDPNRIAEPGLGSVLDSTEPEVELRLVKRALLPVIVLDSVSRQPLDPKITRSTEGRAGRVPVAREGEALVVPEDERRHTLHFELEGYATAELKLPTDLPRPVEVFMQPVAEGATGAFYLVFDPALRGRVAVVGRDANGRGQWLRHVDKHDDEGRWEVAGVPVGEYTITVLATGAIPVTLPGVVVSRGVKSTHQVRLDEGGGLEFKVTNEKGELLDKVHVWLHDAAEQQIDVNILTSVSDGRGFVSVNYLPSAASARTDSGLAPGVYRLTAQRDGYAPVTREFAVRSGEVTEVAISLSPR
jgi:hypothetical protein